jgi:hypothetical protein
MRHESKRPVLAAFIAALGLYGGTALVADAPAPSTSYYDLLAASFLDGRLDLADPPSTEDLTPHGGRWYVAFPPLPALLLVPVVALIGAGGRTAVWFSVVIGALNVALVCAFLLALVERAEIGPPRSAVPWLTLLFGAGTVHWYLAPDGAVWFLAQVCAVTFSVLAAWLAVERRPAWLVGLALAGAIGCRVHLILLVPLLAALALPDEPRARARWATGFAIPLALAMGALAAYNEARFDDPLDAGYAHMKVDADLEARIRAKGYFGLGHVPRNAATALAWPPRLEHGGIVPDPVGMGILFTTPALLFCLRAGMTGLVVRGAWLALAGLLIPILTYHNTGARQFGFRFLLDLIVPALVLLAAGLRGRVGWPVRALVLAGVLVNAWGVAWWYGLGPY